jgi:hypothetical protein
LAFIIVCSAAQQQAMAKKGNQPVYEDPFDLGAGGASLTRASKEGRVFANPALLPQGGGFHRWIGSTLSILVNKKSVDNGQKLLQETSGSKSSNQSEEDEQAEVQSFLAKIQDNPLRVGWGFALSWLTRNVGLSIFSRFEPEFQLKSIGKFGTPEVRFDAESYHGLALGTGIKTPIRSLYLGATAKYIYASEPSVAIDPTNQAEIAKIKNPDLVQDLTSHNKGIGLDLGMLFFFQGKHTDLSVAAKIDDFGNTKFSGDVAKPTEFKQVASAGIGLSFHTGADVIHLSADYRDILGSYQEEMFKKLHLGTKILIRTYIGLSAGYYHGYMSFGAELDLLLLRVAVTSFTRELGDHPEVEPRTIYMASFSFGF